MNAGDTCTLCYIGETGPRLGDRFCKHLRSVKKKADLPVAKIFSSPKHTTDDMMVYMSVVRTGFRNTVQRRSAEGPLIFKCQTLQPRGMNIDLSFIVVIVVLLYCIVFRLFQRALQYCDMAKFELFLKIIDAHLQSTAIH